MIDPALSRGMGAVLLPHGDDDEGHCEHTCTDQEVVGNGNVLHDLDPARLLSQREDDAESPNSEIAQLAPLTGTAPSLRASADTALVVRADHDTIGDDDERARLSGSDADADPWEVIPASASSHDSAPGLLPNTAAFLGGTGDNDQAKVVASSPGDGDGVDNDSEGDGSEGNSDDDAEKGWSEARLYA